MKRFTLTLFLLTSCATSGLSSSATSRLSSSSFQEQTNEYLQNHSVGVFASTTSADGTISVHAGNAFFVDKNLLVTAAHIFKEVEDKPYTVIVFDQNRTRYHAKIVLEDQTNDVALLETEFTGTPLRVREARADDEMVYITGYWIDFSANAINTFAFIHWMKAWPNKPGFKQLGEETLPLAGICAPGMSGSPVIAMDGSVVGILTSCFPLCREKNIPPLDGAVKAKYILQNIRFYREQQHKSQ